MTFNLQFVRYVTAIALALVMLVLVLVVVLAVVRGESMTSTQIVSTLALIGVLVGIIGSLIGTRSTAAGVADVKNDVAGVQDKVNGHLAMHVGHSQEEVEALIDQALAARGMPPNQAAQRSE